MPDGMSMYATVTTCACARRNVPFFLFFGGILFVGWDGEGDGCGVSGLSHPLEAEADEGAEDLGRGAIRPVVGSDAHVALVF